MRVMIASVTMKIPDGMTPEQALRELHTSIAFGQPRISVQFVSDAEVTLE